MAPFPMMRGVNILLALPLGASSFDTLPLPGAEARLLIEPILSCLAML